MQILFRKRVDAAMGFFFSSVAAKGSAGLLIIITVIMLG